ncbi:MAG: hypothetical protein AAFQ94_14220 [Bacteroidota bacterium]
MVNKTHINGILKNIKNKVPSLDWDFVSKYHNGEDISVMELRLFQQSTTKYFGRFTFNSQSGKVLKGRYGKTLRFNESISLTDALLDVLSFEINKAAVTV